MYRVSSQSIIAFLRNSKNIVFNSFFDQKWHLIPQNTHLMCNDRNNRIMWTCTPQFTVNIPSFNKINNCMTEKHWKHHFLVFFDQNTHICSQFSHISIQIWDLIFDTYIPYISKSLITVKNRIRFFSHNLWFLHGGDPFLEKCLKTKCVCVYSI